MWQGVGGTVPGLGLSSEATSGLGISQMLSVFALPLRGDRVAKADGSWVFCFPQVGEAQVRPQQVRAVTQLLRTGLKNRVFWHNSERFLSPPFARSTRAFSQIFTVRTYLELM